MGVKELIYLSNIDYPAIEEELEKAAALPDSKPSDRNLYSWDNGDKGEHTFRRALDAIFKKMEGDILAVAPIIKYINQLIEDDKLSVVNEGLMIDFYNSFIKESNKKLIIDRINNVGSKRRKMYGWLISRDQFDFKNDEYAREAIDRFVASIELDKNRYSNSSINHHLKDLVSKCNENIVLEKYRLVIEAARVSRDTKQVVLVRAPFEGTEEHKKELFSMFEILIGANQKSAVLSKISTLPKEFKDDYFDLVIDRRCKSDGKKRFFTNTDVEKLLGLVDLTDEQLIKVMKRISGNNSLYYIVGKNFPYKINEIILKGLAPVQRLNVLESIICQNYQKPSWMCDKIDSKKIKSLLFSVVVKYRERVERVSNCGWWE